MRRHQLTGYFVTILAGFSFGSIPVIIALLRDVGVSITEQAFLRLFLGGMAGIIVLIFYYINNKEKFMPSLVKNVQITYIWQGLVFTLAIIVSISWKPSGRFPAIKRERLILAGARTSKPLGIITICSLQFIAA